MMKTKIFLVVLLAVVYVSLQTQAQDSEDYEQLFWAGLDALMAKEYDRAIELFKKAFEMMPDDCFSAYNIACAYSLKNDTENALVWFDRAVELGFDDYDHILGDSDLDNIRETEKFRQIIERAFAPRKCPDLELPDLDGKKVSLSQFLGKVIILHFWTTDSPSSLRQIPSFIEIYSEYKGKGLVIIGVSPEGPAKLKRFVRENRINYLILRHPSDVELCEPFTSIKALPATFIIDTEGLIVRKYVGDRNKERLAQIIEQFLPREGLSMDIEKLVNISEEPIPGGYMAQDVNEPGIREAAKRAADLMMRDHPGYKLVKIHEAATQVVAGINYFFILEFETPQGNAVWQLIMYEGFSGDCEITEKKRVK